MTDNDYLRQALQLAAKGVGWVAPNPMVGALIVKDGRVIGQGWHQRFGGAHAERNALDSCTEPPAGASLYVTLEPCCHHGHQPPCTEAIISAGITKVVTGSADVNPLVAGKGIQALRAQGIEVTEGVLEPECNRLNEVFRHYITTRRPFVVLKYAMTLDGKIATSTGASRWITGQAARDHVHTQRHRYSAIMTGLSTVLADDPALTCRMPGGKNPIRIICDTRLRTPLSAQVVQSADRIPTILATCCTDPDRQRPYQDLGCQIITISQRGDHLDLGMLAAELGRAGIDSILLEGGGTLNWAALESGLVNKVQAYLAPSLFGGQQAKTPIEGMGVALPGEAFRLRNTTIKRLDQDFLIESEVDYDVHRDS